MSKYFSAISGTFTPVNRLLLPFVPLPLTPFVSEVQCIPEEHEIHTLLLASKKTSSVPNDLPISFLKEFLPELTRPVYNIFCSSINSGIFPTRWKTEYVSPHPKVLPPASCHDLRNLSLTEFLSKSFERFLIRGTASVHGLLHYVMKYVDPNQFAVPGASCSHALIKMVDFILKSVDNPNKPTAVVNLLADWSKAFNKCNHNIIMRILTAMKVPMWLLRMIMSYLESRKMILRFRGCSSDPEDLPGGMPQGTLLGVILYILYINPVGFPSEVTVNISDTLHNYWQVLDYIPELLPNHETLPEATQSIKFMDDATIQEKIDLTTHLATNLDRSGPLPSWERSGKVLPKQNTFLQNEIQTIKHLSDSREMVLNSGKTCLFIVNFTDNHQFKSLLQIPDCSSPLEVVFETKLLGYWLTKDMKAHRHVQHMLKIVFKRLWAIRKLKKAGISDDDLLHFFFVKIRSVLESNCPVFHSILTQENTDDIERMQKIVLKLILGDRYTDYQSSCLLLDVETLENRRTALSLNFALKAYKSEKFSYFFNLKNSAKNNIRKPVMFELPLTTTTRYYNSPRLYLNRLLEEHFTNQAK